jgi:hypothetical protein
MPLYQYEGSSFSWEDIERFVAPAFAAFLTAARSDFIRVAEEGGAPDELIDMLDSLNEGRQYKGIDDLHQDLITMGHVTAD